jgi:uncharacterized protein (DUF2336 family)
MIQQEAIRVRQAANAMTPPDILLALANDPSVTVRASVAMNPALPARAAAILSADTDARVRTLIGHPPARPGGIRTQQDAVASLTAMIAEAGLRIRANIAQTVQDMPDGPREIVLRLAHDPASMVCGPVIRLSPLLTQQDLLDLVESDPPAFTFLAVASRPGLNEDVSDAIVGSAGPEAVTALLTNRTAKIKDTTLEMLAARAEEQPAWQAALTDRPNVPTRVRTMLTEIISGQGKEAIPPTIHASDRGRPQIRKWSPRRL